MFAMQVFNLVILLALGERLLRADTTIEENDEGELVEVEREGSVRERVSTPLHKPACMHAYVTHSPRCTVPFQMYKVALLQLES